MTDFDLKVLDTFETPEYMKGEMEDDGRITAAGTTEPVLHLVSHRTRYTSAYDAHRSRTARS